MKRIKLIFPVLVSGLLFASCSNDDPQGGGGGPLPIPVFANLYATSNLNNSILSYDFTSNGVVLRSFSTSSADNEGIYYDDAADELVVNSREQSVINTYSNIENTESGTVLSPFLSSNSVLESPRDIAVKDDIYVVSDNADVDGDLNTEDGRFFIFTRDASGYTLRNTVTVNYAVWGIQFIGDDLYTVVDKTSDVAVLKNFITNYTTDVIATPDKQISIEGITRTHGITEDEGSVILTDIGDASNESDGGFQFIGDFVTKFNAIPNGGTLSFVGNQIRVSGALTGLGNPVAVEYEHSDNTVFIAERANDGGKILFFYNIEAGGNLVPDLSSEFPGASSLFYIDK
ncbi:hypothetical protein [Aequorivita lipolytica]|uniref:Uncharacterized protein n=1 Tax=Aequorivita lipolytica TaxID=153267 RepID=A0A5C6YPC5_9FLAO|nr:hypothetical protein [Aequorivita lipolytica]TXD69169.1 hypothetical protein ESV24_08995 [Aequorivita lipolytica]SRX51250.1 hypothetical protein AEQU2_01730 [Aequorivita lipolytica]